MCMSVMEKRLQILLDRDRYARVEQRRHSLSERFTSSSTKAREQVIQLCRLCPMILSRHHP